MSERVEDEILVEFYGRQAEIAHQEYEEFVASDVKMPKELLAEYKRSALYKEAKYLILQNEALGFRRKRV